MMRYQLNYDKWALFVHMRLGKTLTTIRWAKLTDARRILVAAPYSALLGWEETLTEENESWFPLYGTPKQVAAVIENSAPFATESKREWYLVNHQGYQREGSTLACFRWDAVIIDESTVIKSPKANVTKFWLKHFTGVKYRGILSGTPAPENELEYHEQLRFVDPEILKSDRYYNFRFKHFMQPTSGIGWHCTRKGRKFIAKRLSEYCFTLQRSDVGMEPTREYVVRSVELPPSVRKLYDTATDELILELQHETKKTIWDMVAYNWMRQIIAGDVEGQRLHSVKIDELNALLNGELKGERVVVWCHYKVELKRVSEEIHRENKTVSGSIPPAKRNDAERWFRATENSVLVCQPQCYRHGANLSCAKTAIYYSSPTGLETRLQTEDRILDVSDSTPLLIIDIVAKDTVDESIRKGLKKKLNRQELMRSVIDSIKQGNK